MNAQAVLKWLGKNGTKKNRDALARFAIPSEQAFGVPMGALQKLAKQVGRNHALAAELWATGRLEPRLLCAYIDDPAKVTSAQMDRWCRQFDNWAVVDTLCFALFDRTPHAWSKVARWAKHREEFPKRAAFALLWGLTVHDKASGDAPFLGGLALIEAAAGDERNFVRKAVNMALRATGKRNAALNAAAIAVARRLAASPEAAARWNGKDALRELTSASVRKRLAA